MNTKVVYLYLSDNKIERIHPKAFWTSEYHNKTKHTELNKINLYNNKIKFIQSGTFDPLVNLEFLYINKNKLINIDTTLIVNIKKLKHFHIYKNQLTKLPTKWLPTNLESLDVSGNTIGYISINTFEGAFNLNKIEITLNNITIEYDTFSKLTKLTTIKAYPRNKNRCTCKYIWILNTLIYDNSDLCDNSNNNYISIREYLKEECKNHIPGI